MVRWDAGRLQNGARVSRVVAVGHDESTGDAALDQRGMPCPTRTPIGSDVALPLVTTMCGAEALWSHRDGRFGTSKMGRSETAARKRRRRHRGGDEKTEVRRWRREENLIRVDRRDDAIMRMMLEMVLGDGRETDDGRDEKCVVEQTFRGPKPPG